MKIPTQLSIKFTPIFVLLVCIAGCSGRPWPHHSFTVDLSRAQVSREEVARTATEFLLSHGFTDAGKAGQDAINNTKTVLNFQGSDGLLVSVYLNRNGVVPVSFDQDRPSFSDDAQKLFNELLLDLEKKWPGSVNPDPLPAHH